MKVGVFGDSFVDPIHVYSAKLRSILGSKKHIDLDKLEEFKQNFNTPWINVIQQTQANYNINHHSMSGTDIFYSFVKFLTNHHNYDKVVFFVTCFYRLSHPLSSIHNNAYDDWTSITNATEHYLTIRERTMSNYLKYIMLDNGSREQAAQRSMLAYIKHIRPDTKFIHNFADIFEPEQEIKNIFELPATAALIDITIAEQDGNLNTPSNLIDIRANHMTAQNNKIFAQKFLDFLENNDTWFDLNIDDFEFNNDKFLYTKQEILEIATKEGLLK